MYTIALENQAQVVKKFKREITASDKRILELLFSLAIKHTTILVGNRYIAKRLGIHVSTVKRCIKKITTLFFNRKRRWKDNKEITCLTTLLPEWLHIDNLRWLAKKYLPSLFRFPVLRQKADAKLLLSSNTKLQGEMNHRSSTPYIYKLLSNTKSPKKGTRMFESEKPDYVKTFQKEKYNQKQENQQPTPRYKPYVHTPPKPRNYKQDAQQVIEFLSSTDPKYKDAHDFLAFLGNEIVTKLVTTKMAPTGPEVD
jgi:hypothetical protein